MAEGDRLLQSKDVPVYLAVSFPRTCYAVLDFSTQRPAERRFLAFLETGHVMQFHVVFSLLALGLAVDVLSIPCLDEHHL